VHTNGSPLHGIPARPIIQPAVEDPDNKAGYLEPMERAVKHMLDGKTDAALGDLNRAGMIAQNAVRDWFTDPKNNWAPLSPRTIEARARKKYRISNYKKAATKQKYRDKLADYIQNGTFNPLIDTAQLRKSMVYVVRKRGDDE
jgi:hypothetical protein